MPLPLLLLTLLSLLSSPSLPRQSQAPPSLPAEAGTFVYIRQPTAAAEPVAAGAAWTVEVSVYATVDEATPITVTVQLDPRLELVRRAAFGQAGGRVQCVGAFDVTCVIPVKRWSEGYVLLEVTTRADAWPCAPLWISAESAAPGLAPDAVTRERALIGAERCVALPYLES